MSSLKGIESIANYVRSASESIKLKTASSTNVELTPTSTFLFNSGTTDTDSTTLLCGVTSSIEHTRLGVKISGAAIQMNRHITDHNGKSVTGVGSSFWLSGRSDVGFPTEKRRIIVGPNIMVADDDSSTRSAIVFAGDGPDNFAPSQLDAADARMLGGTRIATSSEMYLYLPRPPDGWKVVGCRVETFNKSSVAIHSTKIEVFSRRYITSVSTPPSNSDHLTIHVDQALDKRTCVDVPFTVAWVPSYDDYLVCFVSSGSANVVYMGGYIDIQRI